MFLVFAGQVRAGDSDLTAPDDGSAATSPLAHIDQNDVLRELVHGARKSPGDSSARRLLENQVAQGLPNPLDTTLLPDLPVDASQIDANLGTVVTLRAYLPSTAVEPQHGATFSHVTYIYRTASTPDSPYKILFCCVHYTDAKDADLAQRTGQLLLLARDTLVENLKRGPFNDDRPFDVWLCRSGQAGGEQWRDNIYFYDLDTPRSSIEWIREITHEYSHLALPAIGGYDKPEYWANGYIGERLIVRWLQRRKDGPQLVESLWGTFSGADNFDRLLIAPAIKLYATTGPSTQWIDRKDADGMRYFIGQILTIDDKYGGRVLGQAMSHLPRFREARAADLIASLVALTPAAKTAQKHQDL
jgi:hypothetical protein